MIQNPGHSSLPAGYAAESFMLATVLSALMQAANRERYASWDKQLALPATRISVNRVIAGVRFPFNLTAVLGPKAGRAPNSIVRRRASEAGIQTDAGGEEGNSPVGGG